MQRVFDNGAQHSGRPNYDGSVRQHDSQPGRPKRGRKSNQLDCQQNRTHEASKIAEHTNGTQPTTTQRTPLKHRPTHSIPYQPHTICRRRNAFPAVAPNAWFSCVYSATDSFSGVAQPLENNTSVAIPANHSPFWAEIAAIGLRHSTGQANCRRTVPSRSVSMGLFSIGEHTLDMAAANPDAEPTRNSTKRCWAR